MLRNFFSVYVKKISIILIVALITSCSTLVRKRENVAASKTNVALGLAYLRHGESSLAKKKLLKAIDEAPHYSKAYAAYGYFLEKNDQKKLAARYYRQSIKVADKKELGAAYNNYGTYLYRHKSYKQALYYFDLAAKDPWYLNTSKALNNAHLARAAAFCD